MFVDKYFYNDIDKIRKKEIGKYLILYLVLSCIISVISNYPVVQLVFSGVYNPIILDQASRESYVFSLICSIISQIVLFLFLIQIYRIVQGSNTELRHLIDPLKDKWLIILCVASFIAFLDSLISLGISNHLLILILKLALYYLTVFLAISIYTYPTHAYADAIKNGIKQSVASFKDIVKIDIHYMWVCLVAIVAIVVIVFPILKIIFGHFIMMPMLAFQEPNEIEAMIKSTLPLVIPMCIIAILLDFFIQYRLFCAYYGHALYYYKNYVEIKSNDIVDLNTSIES